MEQQTAQFNWFPGHMNKALKNIEQQAKVVDLLIQVVDARAPISTLNPIMQKLLSSKPMLFIFTKVDLSNIDVTNRWLQHLQNLGHEVYLLKNDGKPLYKEIKDLILKKTNAKYKQQLERGIEMPQINALICGMPNVGKSTFINRISKTKRVKAANTPGVTRGLQRLRIDNNITLIDTPGILPGKITSQAQGFILMATNTIKVQQQATEDFVLNALNFMRTNYKELFLKVLNLDIDTIEPKNNLFEVDILEAICDKFKFFYSDKTYNYSMAIDKVLVNFYTNKFNPMSFEDVLSNGESDRELKWNLSL